MAQGRIILLNGVSSSGKSSLSKVLVNKLPDHFHYSIDDFDLVIERMEDRENQRLIPVSTEYYFHRTIRMFSDSGINVVVDQILHNDETLQDCLTALKGYPVFFVGVHCSQDELERREKERGDRYLGLATTQLKYVHQQKEPYDIEVNTSMESLEACADQIVKKYLDSNHVRNSFL
ncbi:chloramphenicol 3-O phosphotransferase [Mesobacillus persicus]|uniref:Chloramphenicol 3-O phosphotransferase n=1 Tax=Mesobacillus persicus TaxID=930146 RepID=A0A1H8EU62_9BACI|nr:AAA family ATPase [Mesobacillus persicus]SEN22457.1 chloramphenicol 3-O phosphotransferase [Mesobacillus persicus]